jgi:hypothetical protein
VVFNPVTVNLKMNSALRLASFARTTAVARKNAMVVSLCVLHKITDVLAVMFMSTLSHPYQRVLVDLIKKVARHYEGKRLLHYVRNLPVGAKKLTVNVITINTTAKRLIVNVRQGEKHALQVEQLTRAIVQDSAKRERPAMTGEIYLCHKKDPLPVVCQVQK